MLLILLLLQLYIFALNAPWSGRMGGIRGADAKCHKQAKQAGKKGTFRAFLSTKTQDLTSIVYYDVDRSVPIVNMKVIVQ